VRQITSLEIPWEGFVFITDSVGVILALGESGYEEFGLQQANYTYDEYVSKPTYLVDDFNIMKRQDTEELALAVAKSPASGHLEFNFGDSEKIATWQQDAKSGWTIFVMADSAVVLRQYHKQITVGNAYMGFIIGSSILTAIMSTAIVFVTALIVSNTFCKNISAVNKSINDVTGNHYTINCELTNIYEIDNSLMGVCSLADTIKTTIGELEKTNVAAYKFVPEWMLKQAEVDGVCNIRPGFAKSRNLTSVFLDIRRFTSICDELNNSVSIFDFVNKYCELVSFVIKKHNGTIDKIVGDGILALFGAPEDAVACMIELQGAITKFKYKANSGAIVNIQIGIGMAIGMVDIGAVGDENRMSFTVLGRSVNVASRLEMLSSQMGVTMLMTADVINRMLENGPSEIENYRSIGYVLPCGMNAPVEAREIVFGDGCGDDPLAQLKLQPGRHKFIKSFQEKKFGECLRKIQETLENDLQFLRSEAAIPLDTLASLKRTYGELIEGLQGTREQARNAFSNSERNAYLDGLLKLYALAAIEYEKEIPQRVANFAILPVIFDKKY
jgi:class 3 adenylate cyclase